MAYVLNTSDDQRAMLERIGVGSIHELFQAIPDSFQLKRPLNVPSALTEIELTRHLQDLSSKSNSADRAVCFLGGGSYDHFIPAVVDAVASRSEYYTAYTPYQAEASQGSLQAFFEFQTLIAQLTGLDVANASLYDGGSAVAEAVLMALAITSKRNKILIAETVHPEYRLTLDTYLVNLEAKAQTLACPNGFLDPDDLKRSVDDQTLCVIVQHPNFFGCLEEPGELARIAKAKGALFIISFDPISLGLLKGPGACGADIAVAEGQCLGNPMAFGGPYLGILACREEFVRKIPGRLVGQTVDREGKRCWVLTLQTREQHIRRERATSNICTNQGLLALRAAVYLAALGPQGLKETAILCAQKAHYAAQAFQNIPGIRLRFDRPFFKEFSLAGLDAPAALLSRLLKAGFLAGLPLGRWYPSLSDTVSIAVTEQRTKTEIDSLVSAFARESSSSTRH